jgi:putative ABC transport system ATP-binding protein
MEIMALFQELVAAGITLVLVTHEPDIAAHAHRVVTLRDGVISSDETQQGVSRLDARELAGATTEG